MAFPSNTAVQRFDGATEQQLVTAAGGTSAVTSGSFSAAADIQTWTNSLNALIAGMMLEVPFTGAPASGDTIVLYGRRLNINGAGNHEPQPDANYKHVQLGHFAPDPVAATQRLGLLNGVLPLDNLVSSQDWEFYFENQTGQSMPAGWVAKITPSGVGLT